MVRKIIVFATCLSIILLVGCYSKHTIGEQGRTFEYKKDMPIVIDKTTKRQIVQTYGHPGTSQMRGKYEILTYQYSRERAKGLNPISFVPIVGTAFDLYNMDESMKSDTEWKRMVIYTDVSTGLVKDYYYHDYEFNGQDESESYYLKAIALRKQGKSDESRKLLEKSVSLNPKNHRALNSLAWDYIDLNIDVDKGINCAQQAVNIFPDSPYSNGTLGVGYLKKGDYTNAEKYLQISCDLYPIYAPQDQKNLQENKQRLQTARSMKNK